MSTATTTGQSPTKSRREKEKDRREKTAQQPSNERLKTVVRRLPPNLPEEVFWQTVQPWVSDETASWKAYQPGKLKKQVNKENIPSRAYIAFKDEELLIQFSRDFDGHLFKDKAGNESYAIVEYAPQQKVPSEKRKQDSKNNTIEKDDDYISFLESLNTPEEPVSMESLIASIRTSSPPKTTPLLEALKAEKSAQKDKDAILRNHAHYKDQATIAAIATNPNRKEDKKKAAVLPPAVSNKGGDSQPTPSKKSRKAQLVVNEPKPLSHQSGSSTKPSRQQQKQAKHAVPSAAPPVILAAKSPPASVSPSVASTSNATPAAQAAVSDPPPPQRRARAVLGRHLEVALAGVGASVRVRKERERERAKEISDADAAKAAAAASSGEAGPSTLSDNTVGEEKRAPLPAVRHRSRHGGGPPTSQSPESGEAHTTLQKKPSTSTLSPVVTPTGLAGAPSERGRGGGGGGRRGRGRGGGGARGGASTRGG